MFGIFRLVLAVMVIVTHIGKVEIVAGIAVWGFFVLSGFLMTAVLNRKYGFDAAGLSRFALSRSVRLLPTYWVSVLLTAAAVVWGASILDARSLNSSMAIPTGVRDVLANVFIVGHTTFGLGRIHSALSPSSWAVDVEILMYVCSCVFVSRSERMAKFTVVVLAALFPVWWFLAKRFIAAGDQQAADEIIYSFLPAALLPYSVGVWLWFLRERLPAFLTHAWSGVLAASGLLICAFVVSRVSVTASYALTIPCLAVMIAVLATARASDQWTRVDAFCGQLSYPVYLLQWLCAYFIALMLPDDGTFYFQQDGMVLFTSAGFWTVLTLTLLVAVAFAFVLERPIERIRHRFAVPASA